CEPAGVVGVGPPPVDPPLRVRLRCRAHRGGLGDQHDSRAHASEPRPPTPGGAPERRGSETEPMTTSPQSSEPHAEDDLDRFLRDYFATKAPRAFPPLPLDASEPITPLRRSPSSLSRGRLILAACVIAVLLGFSWLLRLAPPSGQSPVSFNDSEAKNTPPH